jgi:hypothetical protein
MSYDTSTVLAGFKSDVYSQTGEDGIIARILTLLPTRDKWCVEFGAWDGRHISNTRRLIEQEDYHAVLIEGSTKRYSNLKANYAGNPRVIPFNKFVGFSANDKLDTILAATPIPRDFDFLSIDIDGNDYHVWDALEKYKPKVVCIEFNPTIPNEVDFVQPKNLSVSQGSSLLAITRLAKRKGYELVAALQFNGFYVRAEYFDLFDIADNRPEVLRNDTEYVTYVFSTFDGRIMLRGNRKLLWHGVEIDEKRLQSLPALFQMHPGMYGAGRRALFYTYLAVMHPKEFFRRMRTRLRD